MRLKIKNNKKMEKLKPLLIKLKNTTFILGKNSHLILNSQQLQLLYILVLNQQIPFYHNFINFLQYDSKSITELIVGIIFMINIIILGYLAIKFQPLISCPLPEILQNFLIKIFKFKFYLLFVITNYLNLKIFVEKDEIFIVIASFNALFAIVQAKVINFVNVSYRFQQKDLFKRKRNSFLTTVIILPILYLLQIQSMIFAVIVLVLRQLFILKQNINSSEEYQVHYSQYLYPLVFLSLCAIESYKSFTQNIHSFLNDDNIIFIAFLFFLIVKTSHELATTLCLTVPKKLIKQHNYFQKDYYHDQEQSQTGLGFFNEEEEEKFILCLRIFIKMYFLRKQSNLLIGKNILIKNAVFSQYDQWWQQFNKIIINHRAYCTRANCHCHELKNRSFITNKQTQQKIFLNVLYERLKVAIANKPFNVVKLSIIEKYFYIQILGFPLKSYYELVKLSSSYHLMLEQEIQLTLLKKQTHLLFEKLFTKERVQNQTLNIDQVIELQNKFSQLKSNMYQLTVQEQKFYTSFSNTYVEIDVVNKMTKRLNRMKEKMDNMLKTQLDKLSRNADLLSFSLIYYKNFDQYSPTLSKIEQKLSLYGQYGGMPGNHKDDNIFSKNIDVFDPQYGAIKIDLVFKPGQIKTITKNLCDLLGFKKQQVQTHKVNKIMPHIFARHHDKFLRNFIEKGSINMLKTKQRTFYARNQQKFILPISVRLKVQYMLESSFSATALIKKVPTHSGFILLNKYGKIEQVSQSVYKMLFQKALQGNVSKVKKINLLKMLLALSLFIKNPGDDNENRVFEGTIITSQCQQAFNSWFKISQLGRQKQSKKTQIQLNSGDSTGRSFTSNRSKQYSQNSSSFMSKSQRSSQSQKDNSENTQKYTTDIKEQFKEYFKLLDLEKIKAFKVSYKFYDLHTAQFSCKVLQITRFWEQLSTDLMKETISREIIEIGEFYGMNELDLERFKQSNVQNQLLASKKQRVKSAGRRGSIYHKFSFKNESVLRVSTNKSLYEESIQSAKLNDLENIDSVGSSLSTKDDKSQGKNAIITAFGIRQPISPKLQRTLTILMLLSSITLLIIGIFSTTLTEQYQVLQNDNMIISNFRNNFQFRLAVQQLYHFYHPLDLEAPQFLLTKKHILTDSMKQQLIQSTQWINDKISDELYLQRQIEFVDADREFVEKRAILSFLGMIYSMFLMTEEQGERLSDNYEEISTKLYDLSIMQRDIILYESDMFLVRIHIIIGLYSILITSLIITLRLIYTHARKKQQQIIQLLTFMNRQRIQQKAQFYQHLGELIKTNNEFAARDVQGLLIELEERNRQELVRQEGMFLRMVTKRRDEMNDRIDQSVVEEQQQEKQFSFSNVNKKQQKHKNDKQRLRIHKRNMTSLFLLQKPQHNNDQKLTTTPRINPPKTITPLSSTKTTSKSIKSTNNKKRTSSLIRIISSTQPILTKKNVLVGIIILSLCIMVIISTEYFYTQADNKFMTYIELKQSSLMLQSIPSRLLLLHLINFDKIVHYEQIVQFDQQFMRRDVSEEYQLMIKMAKYDVQKDQVTEKINEHFYYAVCKLITCENVSLMLVNDSMYDLTYRFENAFNYVDKMYENLTQSLTPKTDILTWVEQNNIIEIFKGTQHILELMKINEQEISTIFGNQIYELGIILLVASLILMPVMLLSMFMMKNKFVKYVYGIVRDCESVLGQFSWGILGENKYAVNYLNGKLKNVKVQE